MGSRKILGLDLPQWFWLHGVVDLLFAIPLFFAPELLLALLHWPHYDPLTTRMVSAALAGIGIESLLIRKTDLAHFHGMLRLKLLWSGTALTGIALSMLMDQSLPKVGWILFVIFFLFHLLWWSWYRK